MADTDPITRVGSLVSKDLLDALHDGFPAVSPKPGDHMDSLMYAAGARMLIQYLQSCYDSVNSTEDTD